MICFSLFSPDFRETTRKKKTCFSHTYRPTHMAPETWASLKQDSVKLSKKIDVYAFSIVMWETLERKPVWADVKFTYKIGLKVCDGERPKFKKRKVSDDSPPYDYYSLMTRCWKGKPESRPSFDEISKITSNWVDAYTIDEGDQGGKNDE